MNPPPPADPAELLKTLWQEDTDKTLGPGEMGPYFDAPLVGVAAADDAWFDRLKEHIGPFHWSPTEALQLQGPSGKARSVISYVLPVNARARQGNRAQTRRPDELWARVRTFGEQFNDRLRTGLVEALRKAGFPAVAPGMDENNDVRDTPGRPLNSRWSERHVAFIAGLGTFGISGGLITQAGIAVRFGSVVTAAAFDTTERPYGDDPFAWCLKTARGTCGACIGRCPSGSIGPDHDQRDKIACREYINAIKGPLLEQLGFNGVYGCGLCQTAVPCESRNPTATRTDEG